MLREVEVAEVSPELLEGRIDEVKIDEGDVLVMRAEDDCVEVLSVAMLVIDTVMDDDVALEGLDVDPKEKLDRTELTNEELEALPVIVIF